MSQSEPKAFFDDPAGTPDRLDYPDADALVLKDRTRVTLHEDGRVTTRVSRAVKIFTEFGRDRLSDEHVVFRGGHQALSVLAAYTFMADGRRVDVPDVTRVVMTPLTLDRAPYWTDFQELVLTNVATEKGAIKVLEYEIADTSAWQPFFWGRLRLGESHPVLEKVVEIEVPAGTPLAFDLANTSLIAEKVSDGPDVYVLRTAELPAFPEEDQPAAWGLTVPTITYSSVASLDALNSVLGSRFLAASEPDDAITAWAKAECEDATGEEDKILCLHGAVVKGTRRIDWPLTLNGLDGRPATEVFSTRHGTPLEMAFLLTAALRSLDIPAQVALAEDRAKAPKETPFVSTEAEAWVQAGAANLCLNAARPAADCGPNHAGLRTYFVFGESTAVRLDPEVGPTEATGSAELTLADDLTVAGSARLTLTGRFNPYLGVQVSEEPESTKGAVQGLAGKVYPGATAESFDMKRFDPSCADVRMQVKAGALEETTRDVYYMSLPPLGQGLASSAVALHRSTRHGACDLGGPFLATWELSLALPKAMTLDGKPEDVDMAAGPVRLSRTWTVEGAKLTLAETLEVTERYLMPEDYGAYRALALTYQNPVKNRIVLTKS